MESVHCTQGSSAAVDSSDAGRKREEGKERYRYEGFGREVKVTWEGEASRRGSATDGQNSKSE